MDRSVYPEAAARIRDHIRRTPLVPAAPTLPSSVPGTLFFKPECLQVSGSFKARGAFNAVLSLPDEVRRRGVVTASGGNFGAAIAYAARELGLPAEIVVMTGSTPYARARISGYGATLHVIGEHWDLSWEAGKALAAERGGALLHPFAQEPVIAGQGTIGLEILEEMPDVDTVVVAIGGGGLIGGISEAIKQRKPAVRIVGVETEACPTLHAARAAGHIVKIENFVTNVPILAARTTEPINFDLVERNVDELVLVPEDEPKPVAEWMWKNTGLAVELGAATAAAAVLNGHVRTRPGEKVVAVLCGSGTDGLGL
ncbi:threonine ammonia-lyase [Prosthecomicrobium pneumaticum]|uniref:Threonine dehydratase n=1 Tax=Prosthecomicrobium pneumaticum TaxID=81895 RepID=A0A7W9CV15_9HYPH|nr:pyridoxal-phosphate dependent enzyme [Prosthecomicrobium pneumaticum]MBB5752438.1 threonine dehydratase [Prosthecomicrobium pneumaticum]